MKIRGEYITAVKERFDREGIDIPYPYCTLEGGLSVKNLESIQSSDEPVE